jgi:hypothetical protein
MTIYCLCCLGPIVVLSSLELCVFFSSTQTEIGAFSLWSNTCVSLLASSAALSHILYWSCNSVCVCVCCIRVADQSTSWFTKSGCNFRFCHHPLWDIICVFNLLCVCLAGARRARGSQQRFGKQLKWIWACVRFGEGCLDSHARFYPHAFFWFLLDCGGGCLMGCGI